MAKENNSMSTPQRARESKVSGRTETIQPQYIKAHTSGCEGTYLQSAIDRADKVKSNKTKGLDCKDIDRINKIIKEAWRRYTYEPSNPFRDRNGNLIKNPTF